MAGSRAGLFLLERCWLCDPTGTYGGNYDPCRPIRRGVILSQSMRYLTAMLLKWNDPHGITVRSYPPSSALAPGPSTGPATSAHSASEPSLFSFRSRPKGPNRIAGCSRGVRATSGRISAPIIEPATVHKPRRRASILPPWLPHRYRDHSWEEQAYRCAPLLRQSGTDR